ncbi:MAG: DUF2437 domain-containing protein [Candidatus Omnitrophica bacterium]|nr:DUF2437 domain-containing protein [Candidatus Omnitrophota bacterium]
MRIVRVRHRGKILWGALKDRRVRLLDAPPWRGIRISRRSVPASQVKILLPVRPSKIVCAGLNYRDHAAELGMPVPKEPVIFLKPSTAVIGPEEGIVYPPGVTRVDYEAELAVVIGRRARNIREIDAARYILGYTCANDVTARHLQRRDGQWTRSKSFDTFCPLGPWVETSFSGSPARIVCRVNGRVCQDSSTRQFIFSVDSLVSFVSRVMTLLPGDVVMTGTPGGIGPLERGDRVEVEIEHIGTLRNYVRN